LFSRWTIAVKEMAISIGKNTAKAGSSTVPRPKPENSVTPEATKATTDIMM
jgi:hypothetical protein